jgi:hypothetical protein
MTYLTTEELTCRKVRGLLLRLRSGASVADVN